ncbi:MAG: ferric reductase-like transmembrane domain-containing protein [Miltoncostaeaceae bacterium]|jgi:sulfoxide reductase heme-binding subunit YedZ
MNNVSFWWILARSSGVIAYVLLTASMVAGVFLHSRLMQRMASPIARMEWHKVLAILALLMVGLHGLGLVMDTYVNTGWLDLIVPGLATYRTLWTGFGVVALWLMLIVSATAGARKHFKARTWKGIHFASYAAFIGATVHGLMTGTDSGLPWMLAIYIASTGLVVGVAARRFLSGPNAPLKRRRAARAASERASRPDHVEAVPESTPVHVEIPPLPPLHDDASGNTRELTMPAGDRE